MAELLAHRLPRSVHVRGDVAVLTCTENVLTEVTEAAHAGATVVATNVLVRRPDGWRVQVHHGSPVLQRPRSRNS